jgi:hypothetical protein
MARFKPQPRSNPQGPSTNIISGPRTNASGRGPRRRLDGGDLAPGADLTTQPQDIRQYQEVANVGEEQ